MAVFNSEEKICVTCRFWNALREARNGGREVYVQFGTRGVCCSGGSCRGMKTGASFSCESHVRSSCLK